MEKTNTAEQKRNEKPDPVRMEVLRSLPIEIKQEITGDEAKAFLYKQELPDSLYDKIKMFLVEE